MYKIGKDKYKPESFPEIYVINAKERIIGKFSYVEDNINNWIKAITKKIPELNFKSSKKDKK